MEINYYLLGGNLDKILLFGAFAILICITSSKLLYKYGVPTLVIFIILGMLCGSDGILGVEFSDYDITSIICSFGLIFIMFYGGFSTNVNSAKSVVKPAVLMSSLGVVLTALIAGLFCYFAFNMTLLEGMLVGSVVSSTDAASVFAILRSKKLNLNTRVASLLEIESGSNDPFAYILTMLILSLMKLGKINVLSIIQMLVFQVVFGLIVGYITYKLAYTVLKNIKFDIKGLYPIFLVAIVVMSYSLSQLIGGNGYLSVYVLGICLGNKNILHKRSLVEFFDGITWLMQIMLFFILGLLSFPSKLPHIAFEAIMLLLFLLLVARPIVTFAILKWFKFTNKECTLISWVGLRGASSIVFAIYALTAKVFIKNDIFHIVFFLSLFSVTIQGGLIPYFAKKLNLIEHEHSIMKTFNDYREDNTTELVELKVENDSKYNGLCIVESDIPKDILIVMIKRNSNIVIPNGDTEIQAGDILVMCSNKKIDVNYLK